MNRKSRLAVSALAALALLFFACTNNTEKVSIPTQPKGPLTLKQKVIVAADSIQLEVQRFRGKNYKRTVYVSVFTQSEYAAQVGNQGNSTPQSEKNLYNSELRLEGLLRANQDYFASYDSTIATQTDGFYVPGTDSLYVILADTATGLGFEDSLTLFHEFVHALQDQYFDLTTIPDPNATLDSYFASDYVVEGEAELLMDYYDYKLSLGYYPSSPTPVINFLNQEQVATDMYLDSLHAMGEPLVANMPMEWEYFSYGPKFINAIAGMNWSIIDNTIFPSLPLRMLEVLHPQNYSANNEYILNVQNLEAVVVDSNVIQAEDELGELFADVMFREWDFPSYSAIPNGMKADWVILYKDLHGDSLRMIWNTYWQDSAASASFFANYASLVNKKRSIQLPAPVDTGSIAYVNDTVHNIYIEQAAGYVFSLENYPKTQLNKLVDSCRTVKPYTGGALAKRRAPQASVPRIASMILKDRRRDVFPSRSGMTVLKRHLHQLFLHRVAARSAG